MDLATVVATAFPAGQSELNEAALSQIVMPVARVNASRYDNATSSAKALAERPEGNLAERPEGNLAAWDEVLFPFDPSLRDRVLQAYADAEAFALNAYKVA